jgi:predicted RNA-binding protein with PUA-like domain
VASWLVKSDPDDYSAVDLERDGSTSWTGVRNPVAQRHLREMKPGDDVLVYHTGDEKAIVATARVAFKPIPDPTDPDAKRVAVQLTFGAWLKSPVTLAGIKADPFFKTFDLVRVSRLSVMPVSEPQWKRLWKLAGGEKRD